MSTAKIEAVANMVRLQFAFDDPWLPVPELVEHLLPKVMPRYSFGVEEMAEMGNRHGYYDPVNSRLVLRADVYDGMCNHMGRDRFTATHEVGHLVLHSGGLNRSIPGRELKVYRDPEWQANTFAAALLMPERMVRACRSVEQVAAEFGVSLDAATLRLKKLGIPT